MARPLLDDELWARIEPLIPRRRVRRGHRHGRTPVSDRATLTGILYVLRSGVPWRFDAWFFGTFAAGGLAIVLTGLFGLVAMTAAERTREVGVRIALGATRERVVRLLVGETASAVAAGLAVGGLAAAWAVRYLKSSMYEMGVYDPRLSMLAALALVIAAGVGAFIPATRASRIDAVRALRED